MDEQISFYMPTEIYTTLLPGGGFVQLDRIEITSVVGLPLGLSWESNHSPANEYFPQTGDSIGCVRVCGTPIQADTFRLTVYLLADVTAPVVGQVKNNSQTYNNAVVIILPDTAGGVSSFSISPDISSSCDPLTLSFEGKIDGSPNPTEWQWDFGNGNTGSGKTPGSQTYDDPGAYPVSLTTTIYNYVITEVRVFGVNNGYTGDIEELTTLQNPDLYFNIPVLGYTSTSGTDSRSATWANLHIVIPQGITQIELRVWDDDNGPPFGSQDDSLGRVLLNVASGTFLWDDDNGTATNGVIVIGDTIGNIFSETLDINIGVKPTAALSVPDGDSICGGDTSVLAFSGTDVVQFAWFKDSVFQQGATDTLFAVTETGTYWVEATSASGCMQASEQKRVQVFATPRKPSVYYNAGTHEIYTTNSSPGMLIQWYRNDAAIPGATDYIMTVTDTGTYTVSFSNTLGCANFSDETEVTSITSMHEPTGVKMLLYPNPNEGEFNLILPQVADDCSIVITDNVGRIVFEDVASAGATYSRVINVSEQSAGLYLCRVLSRGSKTVEKILLLK